MATPKSPQEKIAKIIVYTLIIGAVSMFGYHMVVGESHLNKKQQEHLKTDANPLKSMVINNDRDTLIQLSSGTRISLQKGTFADENGKTIKGNVNLHYREFHNMAETLLGNIPMDYDSAGRQYHFESAGMFEIKADADGQAIKILANKPIQVQLASLDRRAEKFNQYFLENRDGNWKYLGKDTPFTVEKMKPISEPLQVNSYTNLNPKKAEAITQLNPDKQQFKIEIPKNTFPELQGYTNLQFEVSTQNKKFDPAKTQQDWVNVEIEKFGSGRDYKFTFVGLKENYEVLGYPVLDSLNYQTEFKKFEKMHTASLDKKVQLKKQQIEAQQAWEKRSQNFEQATQNYRLANGGTRSNNSDSSILASMKVVNTQAIDQVVYRSFQVKNFGIYNSDCPQNLPNDIIVRASFEDGVGNIIQPQTIYLIEKGKNAVYTYYSGAKFGFNPSSENVILMIINNKLYTVKSEEFDEIKKGEKSHTFLTTIILKSNYKESDILALI